MSDQDFQTIFNLKDEIAKHAAPKNHTDETNKYGEATEGLYGHVKLNQNVEDNNNPVSSAGIIQYVNDIVSNKYNINTDNITNEYQTNGRYNIPTTKTVLDKIDELKNYLTTTLQSKINITNTLDTNSTDDQIPTAKVVFDTISNNDELIGIDLSKPKNYQGEIDKLTLPGYYIMGDNIDTSKTFNYGGESISYTNGLVTVKTQTNRIIQHICTTSKVLSANNSNEYTYKINGSEYTRYGTYNDNETVTWRPWHLVHKPYSKTTRVASLGQNIDDNSIEVYENTAGFIIKWQQNNDNQNRYFVHAPLYTYVDMCTFNPSLPISGPYVFSNLIGRMDVKITPTKMQIRSNIAPNGYIDNIDETYFVPRNQ